MSDAPKPIVLLVDDVKIILSLVQVYLTGLDVQIETASDGEEAWELAQKLRPRVVIADVNMPRRDGISLCAEIRGNAQLSGTSVVLLSAHANEENIQRRARLVGAAKLLPKPITPEVLRDAVTALLNPLSTSPNASPSAR